MESEKKQAETILSATAPTPAITSCRKKKKEDATFLEDVKEHINEFVNASMDEHKSCFTKTIQKVFFPDCLSCLSSSIMFFVFYSMLKIFL